MVTAVAALGRWTSFSDAAPLLIDLVLSVAAVLIGAILLFLVKTWMVLR